jgi:acetylxylan esterase
VDAISNDLSGLSVDYEDVNYDALTTDYCAGVNGGVSSAMQQINSFYARCPDSKLVVSGYSEGATVMGDVLAGGNSDGTETMAFFYFNEADDVVDACGATAGPLSETSGASCNIAAALLWGNPSHTPDQSYNQLSGSAARGLNARTLEALQMLDFYAPRLHDYCQGDDLVCAKGFGADTVEAHTDYFNIYTNQAASWAASMVSAYPSGGYCAVPSTSSSIASSAASSTVTSSAVSSASTPSGNSTSVSTTVESSFSAVAPPSYQTASTMTEFSTAESSTVPVSTIVYQSTDIVSYAPPEPTSTMTDSSSHVVVISYSTSTRTTTYGPYTVTISSAIPEATSTLSTYSGWGNGTMTKSAASGTGVASGTGAVATTTGLVSYTGAANRATVAGGVMGMIGMVYLFL